MWKDNWNIPVVSKYGNLNQPVWNIQKEFIKKEIHEKKYIPTESDFFVLLCIQIKVTHEYPKIIPFLKDKTVGNDLQ